MPLIAGLRSGHLGAAGLDVYDEEPHVPPEARESPPTVLLPHIGSATAPTRDAMARLCAEHVIAVLAGGGPAGSDGVSSGRGHGIALLRASRR